MFVLIIAIHANQCLKSDQYLHRRSTRILNDGDVVDEDDDEDDDDDDDNAQEDLLDDGDNPLEDHLL